MYRSCIDLVFAKYKIVHSAFIKKIYKKEIINRKYITEVRT
jgi:hypothetical protein